VIHTAIGAIAIVNNVSDLGVKVVVKKALKDSAMSVVKNR